MKNLRFFLLIFFIGFCVRLGFLSTHFSHTDDLIVPRTLMLKKENFKNYIDVRLYKLAESDKYLKNFYKEYGDILLNNYSILKPIILPLILSKNTTYAPGQYVISTLLYPDKLNSYNEIKIYSRVINFILFLTLFILLFYLFKKDNYKFSFLIIPIIISLSWTSIIYTVQSSPYLILILSQFYYYYFLLNFKKLKSRNLHFLIIIILPIFNYLNIFFSSICLLFVFIHLYSIKNYKNLISKSTFSGIFFLMIYFFFLKDKTGRTLNWNTGINNEFLFEFSDFLSLPVFFISNSFKSSINHINFTGDVDLISIFYILIFFILIFLGFIRIKSLKNLKLYLIYTILSFFIFSFLILIGKFTLSPTRHTIYLIPFIAIYSYYGIDILINRFDNLIMNRIINLFYFSIIFVWLFNLSNNYNNRKDVFIETEINELIKKYNVNTIILYDWTYQLIYMPSISENYNFIDTGKQNIEMKIKNEYENGSIMFISHHNDKIEYNLAKSEYLNIQDPKLIFDREVTSETEISTLNYTKNGSNNLLIKIFK